MRTSSSTNHRSNGVARVAIVGAGKVGSTTAYALLISGIAADIVLIDKNRRLAEAQVDDLRDAVLFSHATRVIAGELSDCRNADVTIITAGVQQGESRSRLDNLKDGAAILKEILAEIAPANPSGILLIASNPVDVLTYASWKWSGLPRGRVIGSGTTLDTSRFRRRLGALYGVSPDNVHASIIGEHGDSQVPLLSSARIAGMALEDGLRQLNFRYDPSVLRSIADETRTAGHEIIDGKGATYFGIGAALARIVNTILRDERAVLCVSTVVPAAMGLGEVSLSLPTLVGREGVLRVMPIQANDVERKALKASADVLRQNVAMLDLSFPLGRVTHLFG